MRDSQPSLTLREICRQPETSREALAIMAGQAPLLRRLLSRSESCLFTGCGSSYHLAITAARLYQEATCRPARRCPPPN